MIHKILLALCSLFITAGTVMARPANFIFSDNVLSSILINNVYQDSDGMIWISTENGLNRFDGAKVTTYYHDEHDPHSLAHDYVKYVYEDRQGHLFVGSYIGLQLYRADTDDFTAVACYADGRQLGSTPSYLTETADDHLFVSGNVLCEVRVQEGQPVLYDLAWSGLKGMFSKLVEDRNGTMWCRNSLGDFYRVNTGGQVDSSQVAGHGVVDVLSDERCNVYVTTTEQDLLRYDERTDRWLRVNSEPLSRSVIKCVSCLDDHHLLVGTDGSGVKMVDVRTGRVTDYEIDLPDVASGLLKVHQIMRDRDGDLWMALFLKGVVHLRMSQTAFGYVGPLSRAADVIGSNCVSAVTADDQGRLWVGTDGDGTYLLDAAQRRLSHFAGRTEGGSAPSIVQALYEDSAGRMWVGTHGEGCGYFTPTDRRYVDCSHMFTVEGSPAMRVYAFVEDDRHRLWVATMGNGLFCYDLRRQALVDTLSFLSGPDINLWQTTLLITSGQQLLVGTYDGIFALDLHAVHIRPRRIFDRDIIFALCEDQSQRLWAAGPSGVVRFSLESGIEQVLHQREGLAGNVAYSLQSDSASTLWIGTNRGLSHYNPADGTMTNYTDDDGLQGNEFSKNVSCCDPTGRMWFGGVRGLNGFYPSQVHPADANLGVRVTGFYLHNRPITAATLSDGEPIIDGPVHEVKEFSLSHGDNAFSVELSSLSFADPGSMRYLYSVNDGPWTQLPQGSRLITFGALEPGEYHILYKVSQHGNESAVEHITVHIRPYWWESTTACVCYIVVAVLLVVGLFVQLRHHYRVRREMLIEKHAHEIDEAKLRFFTNITHEIRTPMTLIMSPLQKLIDTDDNQSRQESYQTMKRNASLLLQLVNQLLDIRKIDNNQMRLHFSQCDVVQLLGEQADFFGPMAQSKHIDFVFEHDGVEELNMWVDPGYFGKIVMNLLSNAFKYTPDGGRVTLRLVQEPRRSDDEAGHVRLEVSDTGIGISAADKQHIFERFYRASNAHQSADGNGIGLHLTRSLVTLHHGTIEVQDNAEGQGTTFVVRLPLGHSHLQGSEMEPPLDTAAPELVHAPGVQQAAVPEAAVRHATTLGAAPRTKYRLLLVDDDVEIRSYLRRELQDDFRIEECANGDEALRSIFAHRPDLVITDLMMPQVDGLTLCQRIKQNIDLNDIPVILLTAKADQESNIMGLESGADAYVTKPFYIEVLRSTVFNLLQNRKALRNNYEGRQDQTERLQDVHLDSADERLLERIMQSVNKNLSNPKYRIEDLGADVGLSRVHLYRKLRALTNQGPHDFVRNIRLKEAARLLLREDSYSINEIATAVGFLRPNNFTSAFKAQYGYAPMQWRAMQRKKKNS
ncbi:MAG: response regulator [Bacteroidales bacterium]|nr:response regulator [Bacteroidales bacterium]